MLDPQHVIMVSILAGEDFTPNRDLEKRLNEIVKQSGLVLSQLKTLKKRVIDYERTVDGHTPIGELDAD